MMALRTRNKRWSDIDMSQLELSNLILHFAQSNKADGKSPKTVSWYSEMLNRYVMYLEANAGSATLSNLGIDTVRQFILFEQGRNLSPNTIACRVRALKAFASWLLREGYASENILINLKLPKIPKKVIEPLTQDEVDRLIKVQNPLTTIYERPTPIIMNLDRWTFLRNRLMFLSLFTSQAAIKSNATINPKYNHITGVKKAGISASAPPCGIIVKYSHIRWASRP